uniref:Uncharacterized protein n=1 Tax=Arundo donax TaxID=35708 RepID=A0A0A8YGI5_ARUDO
MKTYLACPSPWRKSNTSGYPDHVNCALQVSYCSRSTGKTQNFYSESRTLHNID